ncbi:hypothetical protein TrLO_g14752 [Triparma laevis f. longispina]|uniref:BZIP domain-containing protein n=1 Tax=Triparma laevis f. longispina TaxID=1714387 RepID=A0A9W7FGN3_9STRA|nr:hypothetical protein TrLO_g14752 [Triparma laevis f. longispina]
MTELQQKFPYLTTPSLLPANDDILDQGLLDESDFQLLSTLFDHDPAQSESGVNGVTRASSGSSFNSTTTNSTTSGCGSGSIYSDSDGSESPRHDFNTKTTETKVVKPKRSKMDKATERKMKNRESAKNSYLKKKAQTVAMEERIKGLETANALLTSENSLLKEENSNLKSALQNKERELYIEDIPLDLDGSSSSSSSSSSSELPLYETTTTTTSPKSNKRPRNESTIRSDYSTSNTIKLVTLPIAAISSTLCMLENTSNVDSAGSRFSGSIARVSGGLLPTWFLVVLGVLAAGAMLGMRNSWFPVEVQVLVGAGKGGKGKAVKKWV